MEKMQLSTMSDTKKTNTLVHIDLKVKLFCVFCICLLLCGYTYSNDGPYLDINCAWGNNVRIYFNTTTAENRIVYDDSLKNLINVSSSTQYGYVNRNGTDYRITFPTYDIPYYTVNYNQDVYLNNVEIIKNHNVKFYRSFDDSTIMFGCVGVLLLFIFLKER